MQTLTPNAAQPTGTATAAATGAMSGAPAPSGIDLSGADPSHSLQLLAWLVGLYVVLLVLSVMLPVLFDIWKAYAFARYTRGEIIGKINGSDLDREKLRLLLTELNESPPGIPGLGRSTMALTIILILAVAVVHLLVVPTRLGDNGPIVGNVLSLLGGALASITGFYFGGKTSQEATQRATLAAPTGPEPGPGELQVTTASPAAGGP
jgi:hypothetical protein